MHCCRQYMNHTWTGTLIPRKNPYSQKQPHHRTIPIFIKCQCDHVSTTFHLQTLMSSKNKHKERRKKKRQLTLRQNLHLHRHYYPGWHQRTWKHGGCAQTAPPLIPPPGHQTKSQTQSFQASSWLSPMVHPELEEEPLEKEFCTSKCSSLQTGFFDILSKWAEVNLISILRSLTIFLSVTQTEAPGSRHDGCHCTLQVTLGAEKLPPHWSHAP